MTSQAVVRVVGRTPLGGGSSSRRLWREAIREAARQAGGEGLHVPDDADVEVEVLFLVTQPRVRTIDLDNMVKPVLDTLFHSRQEQIDPSLTGTLLGVDDARITRLVVTKREAASAAEEGVEIVVRWDGS
jgi:hypothetical protein